MKAPDKIFFPNDINLLTKLSLVIKQKDDVCYIRKDALLEWAKKEMREWSSESKTAQGVKMGLTFVIDKIESL